MRGERRCRIRGDDDDVLSPRRITGGRKNVTCLMRLKADLSRDRLSFRVNDPRPSVSVVEHGRLQSRCSINSSALRRGENSIPPTDPKQLPPAVGPPAGTLRGFRVAYTWCRLTSVSFFFFSF